MRDAEHSAGGNFGVTGGCRRIPPEGRRKSNARTSHTVSDQFQDFSGMRSDGRRVSASDQPTMTFPIRIDVTVVTDGAEQGRTGAFCTSGEEQMI